LTDPLTATGALTDITGTLYLNGNNLTANALTVVDTLKLNGNETITAPTKTFGSSSTALFVGDGDGLTDTFTPTNISTTYANLVFNATDGASDTFTLGNNLTVTGNLTITAGVLDVNTTPTSYAINLAGNWSNSGTFTPRSGTVTFNGTNQSISGTTTFNNFTKQNTLSSGTNYTLTFEATKKQTITSTWTVQGHDGSDRVLLRSSSPGTQWQIDPQSTRALAWIDVQDSNNTNATAITMCAGDAIDSGRNTNWNINSATLTQNDWRWYADNDTLNPTDPWGNPDLVENGTMTILPATNQSMQKADEARARVNLTVTGGCNLYANQVRFKLQAAPAGAGGSCTAGGLSWTDVGAGGSGDAWRYATSSVSDGATLTTAKLSTTNVLENYVKTASSSLNPNSATVGQNIEYDFHFEHNGATANSTYCFRAVKSDGTVLDAYNSDGYPKLETRPSTENLMRHGQFFKDETKKGFLWAN
jgi:hypothetical protein